MKKYMKLAVVFVYALLASNAFACLESEESKNSRFAQVDINSDSAISFEEYITYEKDRLKKAEQEQPGSFKKFIGRTFYGRTYNEDFSFNETMFRERLQEADKDKNNSLSKEEFLAATQQKRFGGCGQ